MPTPSEKHTEYVGLPIRSIAYLIDSAIAFGFFAATQLLIFTPVRKALGLGEQWFYSGVHTELYTLLTVSLPIWLYFALSEQSSWQATVGKRLLKVKVFSTTSQRRIRFSESLLRTFVKLLPWEIAHLSNNLPEPLWYASQPEFRVGFVAVGVLMGLYIAMVALTKKRQGLHDLLARTVILKDR